MVLVPVLTLMASLVSASSHLVAVSPQPPRTNAVPGSTNRSGHALVPAAPALPSPPSEHFKEGDKCPMVALSPPNPTLMTYVDGSCGLQLDSRSPVPGSMSLQGVGADELGTPARASQHTAGMRSVESIQASAAPHNHMRMTDRRIPQTYASYSLRSQNELIIDDDQIYFTNLHLPSSNAVGNNLQYAHPRSQPPAHALPEQKAKRRLWEGGEHGNLGFESGGGGDSEGLRSEVEAAAQAAVLTAEARRPAVPKLSLPLGNVSGGGGGGAANSGGTGRGGTDNGEVGWVPEQDAFGYSASRPQAEPRAVVRVHL